MLELIVLVASLGGSAGRQAAASPPSCRGVEVTLRVTPPRFRRGMKPRFAVVLKNASQTPVRLLDVREGRRPDLAENYYEIIVEQNERPLRDVPRAISDPGPVQEADFFVLSPGATVETPLTTKVDVSAVPAGLYSAFVRINFDPLSTQIPECRSARISFTVDN
jgi:hypothetical protein